jgi:hypothetical protein
MQQYIGISPDAIEMVGFFYDMAHIHGSDSTFHPNEPAAIWRRCRVGQGLHWKIKRGICSKPTLIWSNTHAIKLPRQADQRLKARMAPSDAPRCGSCKTLMRLAMHTQAEGVFP